MLAISSDSKVFNSSGTQSASAISSGIMAVIKEIIFVFIRRRT